MLVHEPGAALGIAARPPRTGRDKRVNLPGRCDAEKTKAQQTAKPSDARIRRPIVPAQAGAYSEPDLVAGAGPIHALQEELEVEPELQLANTENPSCSRKRFTGR